MSTMVVLLLASAGCSDAAKSTSNNGDVQIKPVTYAGFQDTLKEQRGKVVVVDYWADFCGPCKVSMPHLVELQKKYATDGLAVVTVNIDDPKDEDARQSALQFLQKINAPFINLAKESQSAAVWEKELTFQYIPHAQVYNRQGELVKEFSGGGKHNQIEELVAKLLQDK
jgi:thiol-disulfide isomerase/thioredoxin